MRLFHGFLFLFVLVIQGCVTTHHAQRGTNTVTVGEVPASKQLIYIGGSVEESLLIRADENGNASIISGRGLTDMIPVHLSPAAISELNSRLDKMVEWGGVAQKNGIETTKIMEQFMVEAGFADGSVFITPRFISGQDGKAWVSSFEFCQFASQADLMLGPSRKIGSSPCVKNSTIYLVPSSVAKLKNYLAEIPNFSKNAAKSKANNDLFK